MSDTTPPTKQAGPPRRRRRAGLWVLLSVTALIFGAGLGFLALTGTPLTAPDWMTRSVEQRLNDGMGGGRVSVGQMQLVVDRRAVPRVRMRNVGIFDKGGAEIARLNEVGARLAKAALARGVAEMRALQVSGAQITIRRRGDGTFDLTFGTGPGASGTLAGVLDLIDQAFSQPPLSKLERVTADQLTITLEDSRSARIWQVTDGQMTLDQSADSLDVTVSADVFNGTEELASTVMGFRTEKGSPEASFTATFENATAADIAAQSPALAFLEVIDAPISGALRAAIDTSGTLSDLAGTLEIGAGALHPTPETRPIRFNGAQAYVDYDPAEQKLSVSGVRLDSDAARGTAEGVAFLQDFRAGWPEALVGQLSLADVGLQPGAMFAEPMQFASGAVDFRLRLDPFSVEIGQLSLQEQDRRFLGTGLVKAEDAGWGVSLDLALNTIPLDRLLALWPVRVAPGARSWIERNTLAGELSELSGAFRLYPDQEPQISLSYLYSGANVKFMKTLPPVTGGAGYASLVGKTFTQVIEKGQIEAPQGGSIDMAGSVFRVGDITVPPGRAELTLETASTITAALSLLDLPPFELMQKAELSPDLADGNARLRAEVAFDLERHVALEDVGFTVAGTLTNFASDTLVKNRRISAPELELRADEAGISIGGRGRLGAVPADVMWAQVFGPETKGKSRAEGTIELSQAFLDEFGIALPPGSVSGQGVAQFSVDLVRGQAPRFSLLSDLNRLGLRLAAVDWAKSRNQTGSLEIAGRLGSTPAIDRLVLDAPGLSARGVVDLNDSGGMDRAQFDRVRIGRWLDGPVTLTGRGAGQAPAVAMSGGSIDLRNARFGNGGGDGSGGGPITLALDRMVVSEGIVFTSFSGRFQNTRGLGGQFTARINGRAPVVGTVVPTPSGAAVRLVADDAGGAMASAGILQNARGGRMDLTLNPTGGEGVYDGRLRVSRTRIIRAPALTELLSAISIVGLLDQMNSGGITLSEVDAEFQLTPRRLTLYRSSAVGPSLGISLDGVYDLASGRLDMQGVLSPVYFLNAIGQVFSRRGEGVFGFNFRLRGEASNPSVAVNPLSILTPGMFREIFRRAPPQPGQ
ncbi:MAG: hypothetical protein QNJ44_12440 [Rhodobacter sp.]|nr:hypothetical protein [Rhodobacter sp.]